MSISLIANSGIQFHKFILEIKPDDDIIKTLGFYEVEAIGKVTLEYAYCLPDYDIWVSKNLLKFEKYIDENGKLSDNINLNTLYRLNEDVDYFTVSDIEEPLNKFENVWLPIPYFKKDNNGKSIFGPIAWARMMLKNITLPEAKNKTFQVVLAFDTTIDNENKIYFAPRSADTNERNNCFSFSNNEDHNLDFCNHERHCGWVFDYLRKIDGRGERPYEFPYLKYLAYYLYLVKYLEALTVIDKTTHEEIKAFPDVILFPHEQSSIDVDLVLDIGNSNTCGLLFENPPNNTPFQFTAVKKLKLQDLSEPEKEYNESFSMRLAFAKAKFGEIDIPEHKNYFRWPSLLRLGKEAERLISKYNLDNDRGVETATHHSSPKRYLWDNRKSEIQWEFINFQGKRLGDAIYYEGISEQFKENGDYSYDGDFSCTSLYSRKSLMTFVYMEIILHALAQINSHEFRTAHGSPSKPRKLKRITITCPTLIVQKEQVILRECAVEAVLALKRFAEGNFLKTIDKNDIQIDIKIIPKPKDLAKDLLSVNSKTDWIYDEATCCQLVFLYSELSKKFLNNCETYFDLFGKKREDSKDKNTKSITIGSLDIGGGTTDLMICAYQYDPEQSNAVITPHPLYWESFNLAGDDLLKEIIQQVILEGTINNYETDKGCTGVIENYSRERKCNNISEIMNNFFGTNNANQSYLQRIYRKNFIVQIAIPIALRYLQHAADNRPDEEVTFNDLFPEIKPNPSLINYFNNHFKSACSLPFDFKDIKWKLSRDRIFNIVEKTFDTLLKQVSLLMSAYGCDFILLAGKPTSLDKIREIIIKYFPVSPDRIISLNNYRVGRWYPFANDTGYIDDNKTIVTVGALIALMGGDLDKLQGFKLINRYLIRNLISTSDYIGILNQTTQTVDLVKFKPETKEAEIPVNGFPIIFGYKQLENKNYPGKPIYILNFNHEAIKLNVLQKVKADNRILRYGDDKTNEEKIDKIVTEEYNKYLNNLKNRMPFKVTLKRDYKKSKEDIVIENITDKNKNDISKHFLSLSLMTLHDEHGYWLDTGEFVLNIKK